MISIFTTPKAFKGHIGIIQSNAITSWINLHPDIDIIIVGENEGVQEFALKHKLAYISRVKTNTYGTPLVSSLFKLAESVSKYETLAYINADIILGKNFLTTANKIRNAFDKYLIVGKRIDINFKENINFKNKKWYQNIKRYVEQKGVIHSSDGADYFVFNSGLWKKIPDFSVGRSCWDNWLIYGAMKFGGTVVDASSSILAIHQNHDYFHIPNGLDGKRFLEEARVNFALSGKNIYTIEDANYFFSKSGLVSKKFDLKRLLRIKKIIELKFFST